MLHAQCHVSDPWTWVSCFDSSNAVGQLLHGKYLLGSCARKTTRRGFFVAVFVTEGPKSELFLTNPSCYLIRRGIRCGRKGEGRPPELAAGSVGWGCPRGCPPGPVLGPSSSPVVPGLWLLGRNRLGSRGNRACSLRSRAGKRKIPLHFKPLTFGKKSVLENSADAALKGTWRSWQRCWTPAGCEIRCAPARSAFALVSKPF